MPLTIFSQTGASRTPVGYSTALHGDFAIRVYYEEQELMWSHIQIYVGGKYGSPEIFTWNFHPGIDKSRGRLFLPKDPNVLNIYFALTLITIWLFTIQKCKLVHILSTIFGSGASKIVQSWNLEWTMCQTYATKMVSHCFLANNIDTQRNVLEQVPRTIKTKQCCIRR